jgi:hypothetical protein
VVDVASHGFRELQDAAAEHARLLNTSLDDNTAAV